jgi:pimeloyl-ACP methyl ester carboxylesterase
VTGSDLARALKRVGIEADAGPRLTIVAHSMGGLVARCFIERQGGSRLTDRLITCGTPHLGSPWPRVEDVITALLGLALNLSLFAGGVGTAIGSVLAGLGRAAESIDTALDQMRPGSDLLTTLAGAPDPGVPYTLIRGTRPFPASADPSRAQRVVGKLTGAAIDVLFGGAENDIAVSVASAGGVGQTWPNRPRVLDVGCNHVTYFADQTAVAAVKAALTS